MTETDHGGEQSLGRASTIMRLVAGGGSAGIRLLDLAVQSGIARPTVHRILKRLCSEGWLVQDRSSKRYCVGSLAFELGLAARAPSRRLDLIRPHLQALA